MNKHIQMIAKGLIVTGVVILAMWSIGYFFLCFVEWDMLNPIQGIIDLPIASPEERIVYFLTLSVVTGLSFVFSPFVALPGDILD